MLRAVSDIVNPILRPVYNGISIVYEGVYRLLTGLFRSTGTLHPLATIFVIGVCISALLVAVSIIRRFIGRV